MSHDPYWVCVPKAPETVSLFFLFEKNTVQAFHLDQVAKPREVAVQLVKVLLPDS